MTYHTLEDGSPYWDESVYYQFTSQEIDTLESATLELDKMCLAAVDHIISQSLFSELQVPDYFVNLRQAELGERRPYHLWPL